MKSFSHGAITTFILLVLLESMNVKCSPHQLWLRRRLSFTITRTWNNQSVSKPQEVQLELFRLRSDEADEVGGGFAIDITAPFYNDPPPPGLPGRVPGLWNYEVVETFFLGRDDKYLELEFGPWGHYLAYYLEGAHNVTKEELPIHSYHTSLIDLPDGGLWLGRAVIPRDLLPPAVHKFNAYAIHGLGEKREHLALYPIPANTSDRPDFHRLDAFQPIDISGLFP